MEHTIKYQPQLQRVLSAHGSSTCLSCLIHYSSPFWYSWNNLFSPQWRCRAQYLSPTLRCLCICCICHRHSIHLLHYIHIIFDAALQGSHTTSYPSFPLLEVIQDTKISNTISHWLPFPQALKTAPNVTTSQQYSPSVDVKSLSGSKSILLVWSDYSMSLYCFYAAKQSPPWPPPQGQPNTAITNTTTATTTTTTTGTTTATTTAKPIPQQLLPMNAKALCHSSDLSQALIAALSLRHSSPREGSKHTL